MGAAYAYSRTAERAPERARRPRVNVVPGRRQAADASSHSLVLLTGAVVVVAVVIALLGFARVYMNHAALSATLASQELSSQIVAAREEGNKLEVAQSTLSNPTRVKTEAAAAGMRAPANSADIYLPRDVVVTDEAGNLLLSSSVAVAAQG